MKTFTIQCVRQIPQESIDDVLVTAFEGGITYWCGDVRVKKSPDGEDYKYASEALTRGHELALYDPDEAIWRPLTLNSLLDALGKYNFDFDDYDAGDADTVVQMAVFGEVVYG